MIKIKFSKVGLSTYYDFSTDDIAEVVCSEIFKRYLSDGYVWGVVGSDGLTFVERLEKQHVRIYRR